MSARLLDIAVDAYHRDPCEVPSLSQSIAHTLITKSPLHAWTEHPRLGNVRRAPTEATDDGSIIHSMLLGVGADLDVIKADNFRTKAAQELREAAREAGRIPVLERKFEELQATARKLNERLAQFGIALSGRSEVSVIWTEDGAQGEVVCRCRMDHLMLDEGVIYDVKKVVSADPRTRATQSFGYGYDIQAAAYRSALAALRPDLAGRIQFIDIWCELEPPYCVVPAPPNAALLALGESRWRRAVLLWEQCLRTDTWPGYPAVPTDAPNYALIQEEEIISGSDTL